MDSIVYVIATAAGVTAGTILLVAGLGRRYADDRPPDDR